MKKKLPMNVSLAVGSSIFGTALRIKRLTYGLTQEEMGRLLGVTKFHICRMELGRRGSCRKTKMLASEILGIPKERLELKKRKRRKAKKTDEEKQRLAWE